MKKSLWSYGMCAVILVLIVLGIAWAFFSFFQPTPETSTPAKPSGSAIKTSISAASNPAAESAFSKAIQSIFSEKNGWHVMPSISDRLQQAVASGDETKILQAFQDAVYSHGAKMSDAIPALKAYLNDSNPYVRYLAAKYLLTAGDASGDETLVALTQAARPIMVMQKDIRVAAAEALAQFRQPDAANAIIDLYPRSSDFYLSVALSNLGIQFPQQNKYPFVLDALAITQDAQTGVNWFTPQITDTFLHTNKPDLKAACAWALAIMNNDPDAANYLLQQAQAVINPPAGTHVPDLASQTIFEYLGALQTPEAKQALEAVLDTDNQIAVQVAVVNLIFNQGGSDKANQVVAQDLTGQRRILDVEFALDIAAKSTDPQVQAALQVFAQKDPDSYRYYVTERKDWPIYNWIDNYVIKLNTQKQ